MEQGTVRCLQIFDYTDYRLFLKDFIARKKNKSESFSLRGLAKRAGINSPNYLQRVISGKSVGPRITDKLVKMTGLKGLEEKYFRLLVEFSETRSSDKKGDILSRLRQMSHKVHGKLSTVCENDIRRDWYLVVIWEMAAIPGVCLRPNIISQALRRKITSSQAEEALNFLVEKGYLIPGDEPDSYKQSSILLNSTDEINDLFLKKNHKAFIEMSLEHLDQPLSNREFQGLTISVNPESFGILKTEIKKFVHETSERFSLLGDGSGVARLNIQLFPVSKID